MTGGLALGRDLVLPVEFATEGVLVTGMRGSGKSNTIVRWMERLDEAGIPWVSIDPKGDHWGVQSSADGTRPGLSVPVFGGLHGNFPLTEDMGDAIANLLVDRNISAVLDVSRLSIAGRRRFLIAFFNRLMERHQVEPHTRCVVMEEAHRYIPQQVPKELTTLKEAAAAILLEGRFIGLGCWAVSQRPARLNKDVTEEVGTAIIHRVGVAATNDKRTVGGWMKEHAPELVEEITKLAAGEAIVLAPEFGLVGRYQVDRRTTFDSGATPKAGAAIRKPTRLADIDAAELEEQLADAIEKAKENDPGLLRERVRLAEHRASTLEEQLTVAYRNLDAERAEAQAHVCAPTYDLGPLTVHVGKMVGVHDTAREVAAELGALLAETEMLLRGLPAASDGPERRSAGPAARRPVSDPRAPVDRPRSQERPPAPARRDAGRDDVGAVGAASGFNPSERRILTALFQFGPRDSDELAMLIGCHPRTKGHTNALGSLRSAGLLSPAGVTPFALTDAGVEAAASIGAEPMPRGAALYEWIKQHPSVRSVGSAGRVMDAVRDLGVTSVDALAEHLGVHPRTKGFTNALGRLRTLNVVTRGGEVRLTDDFLRLLAA